MNRTATTPQVTPAGWELAARLERLLELPVAAPADLAAWEDASRDVQVWLEAHAQELPFELPQHLMFYFHDSDIRAREPDYQASQEQAIRRLIRQLRGEEAPDIRRPWWRCVLAALLAAVFLGIVIPNSGQVVIDRSTTPPAVHIVGRAVACWVAGAAVAVPLALVCLGTIRRSRLAIPGWILLSVLLLLAILRKP